MVKDLEKLNTPLVAKNDQDLIQMITNVDFPIEKIEAYLNKTLQYYNFVSHVFFFLANAPKPE